jgi:hypothetical protein
MTIDRFIKARLKPLVWSMAAIAKTGQGIVAAAVLVERQ